MEIEVVSFMTVSLTKVPEVKRVVEARGRVGKEPMAETAMGPRKDDGINLVAAAELLRVEGLHESRRYI